MLKKAVTIAEMVMLAKLEHARDAMKRDEGMPKKRTRFKASTLYDVQGR